MCFSATASFCAGGVLAVAGVASIVIAKPKPKLVFASIPMLFAVQQFAEGTLWLTLSGQIQSTFLQSFSTAVFSIFAWVVWPTWIPLSIMFFDKQYRTRKLLLVCLGIGIVVSSNDIFHMVFSGVQSSIDHHHIFYNFAPTLFWSVAYMIPTLFPFFMVKNRLLNILGVLTTISAIASALLVLTWFTSVWCFFAAILSVTVLYIVRKTS